MELNFVEMIQKITQENILQNISIQEVKGMIRQLGISEKQLETMLSALRKNMNIEETEKTFKQIQSLLRKLT